MCLILILTLKVDHVCHMHPSLLQIKSNVGSLRDLLYQLTGQVDKTNNNLA